MTNLKPFQAATVETVLKAFRRRQRVRRFLVADEVGLGKTVVAQHVIRSMMRGLSRPLIVFYLCSNLAIARQNRRKLLEVLPSEEQESADCPVDRLSLLPASERPSHKRLNLYSLTPDTSIPIRKQHRRDGRQEERALVHVLIERVWPALFDAFGKDVFQRNASVHWRSSIRQHRDIASSVALREAFARSVRKEFGLEAGEHLVAQLRSLNDSGELDEMELIAHLRNALAASAIEEISPDLVIFDEFQRFQDLLDPPDDLEPAAKRVIGRLRGDDLEEPPALLLLSATPYRLFTRRWEEETGASHREEFFDLVDFLYGSDADAHRKRSECEVAFQLLEKELRKGQPLSPEAAASRQAVEALLCPIIARTERASHENGWDHFLTESLPAPITREDITVFKHLSGSLTDGHRSSAVPYWTSIPLPMQTMGNHYVAWKLSRRIPADGVAHLSKAMRDRFERPQLWPHPRLRAIKELMPLKQMALPWLMPTAPWWPLRGAWKDRGVLPRKLLVFSRFRAVPQSVAAALSFDLEAQFLAEEKLTYAEVSKRRLLSATDKRHTLLGLFHPSPFLVTATDPLAAGSDNLQVIRRTVRQQLMSAMKVLGLRITDKARALPIWRALARIESRAGNWDWISQAWWDVRQDIATGAGEDSGLAQLLSDWDAEAEEKCDAITPTIFETLVDYAIGSPGVVVGRALRRHWPEAVSKAGFVATLDAAWNGLRNYLDQRWFYHVIRKGEETYPDALLRV
ncbi:MAG: helicase, partial [Actinobacteria bacterium]|nr:helicase [Actinomycetota bacterium]